VSDGAARVARPETYEHRFSQVGESSFGASRV